MVKLNIKKEEIKYLNTFIREGHKSVRAVTRARILLLAQKKEKDVNIQRLLNVGRSTVWRVKNNYLNKGVDYALTERERPGQPPKYKTKHKAEIIAYACTTPPQGRKRWSVRLLAEELRKKKDFTTINRESIRMVLKKVTQNLG